MRKTRMQFMNGEIPKGCAACLREVKYQPTVHEFYQSLFAWDDVEGHYNGDTGEVDQTRYLLVALSNLCTYSCRMCFDLLSTRLSADRHRIFGSEVIKYKPNNIDKLIAFIRRNPLHTVTFHGGNPLSEPRFLDVIEAVDSSAKIEIISNGSTLSPGGVDVLPHLRRFAHVHFNISLDGTAKRTEYIRRHSDFEVVVKHFDALRAVPGATVNIHNTITNLNVFDLPAYYSKVLFGR